MGEHDRDSIDADHLYVDMIRLGQVPTRPDQLAGYLLAWRAEVERGLDEAFRKIRTGLFPEPQGQEPAMGAIKYGGHQDWPAPKRSEYSYTDPVADPAWPGISEVDDDDLPDRFPDGWSLELTERDRAAVVAGNA